MPTFLLVHGAWHNHLSWYDVPKRLRQQGHRVLVPDLPGHSLPQPSSLKGITLETYCDFLVDLVLAEPEPIHLVGHSMSGIILLSLLNRISDRISSLQFIAAFTPPSGSSLFEQTQQYSTPGGLTGALHANVPENRFILDRTPQVKKALYGNASDSSATSAMSKLLDQPLSPMNATVHWQQTAYEKVGMVRYIGCSEDLCIPIADQKRMASYLPGAQWEVLKSDHSPQLSCPAELCEILCC